MVLALIPGLKTLASLKAPWAHEMPNGRQGRALSPPPGVKSSPAQYTLQSVIPVKPETTGSTTWEGNCAPACTRVKAMSGRPFRPSCL